jgi:uncharacterized protein (TIGR00369 family)
LSADALRPPRPRHFLAQLDFRDVEVDGVDLAMEMGTGPHLTNNRGALQGGLIATLIDIVAGRLALQGLPAGAGVATSDLNIHYLAPVLDGPAQARAKVLRRGSRSVVVDVEVYDVAADTLAAVSTIAFAIMRPRLD